MYPKRRRTVRQVVGLGLLVALTALALNACGAGGQEASKKSATGDGPAATNGQIAFRRYFNAEQTKGALFTMNPDGSHLRQITHPPKGLPQDDYAEWSPDGKRIVFQREPTDFSTNRIMVVNSDTGDTRTVVIQASHPIAWPSHPDFTPDGQSIAYSRVVAPPNVQDPPEWKYYSAIFIVGLDGSDPRQVTSTPKRHKGQLATETTDPAFSPNGKMLTFVRYDPREKKNDRFAVFVQPIGSPEDAQRITPWKLNCQDKPEFSPDGELLLFRCLPEGEEGPSNLYWVHPDGTGLHKLTHEEDADKQYLGSSFSPSFSEGEGWITVGCTGGHGDEGNADVFRILIEDGEVVREVNLTKSEKWDSAPVWGSHQPVG
jgi:Tol biopolymer transport system component